MHATLYPDVNCILADLLAGMQRILGEKLIGLYLYGSLTTGDFDPMISDIDLLAALTDDLIDHEFDALDRMQNDLVIANPHWYGRIEIGYMTARGLKTFRTEASTIAIISPGEPFHRKEAGKDWLINWYIVRRQGRTLYGPSPKTLIDPISHEEYLSTVRSHTLYWAEWVYHMTERKGQSYVILTLCRALYALHHGEQTSKLRAATWATEQWPEWSALILNALAWRAADDDRDVDHDATFAETVRFVQFMVGLVKEC